MAQVHFTAWLREWAPREAVNARGATVGEALSAVFQQQPQLRGYLLDERGALRKHVCIFADGQRLAREATMSHPVAPDSKLYVMQALSGG
jgi:sulfur-carrier protein